MPSMQRCSLKMLSMGVVMQQYLKCFKFKRQLCMGSFYILISLITGTSRSKNADKEFNRQKPTSNFSQLI